MKVEFGIMQGRLTPQYKGRYQSHPKGHWQSEFYIAKSLNLSLIEFIIDSWSVPQNPLLSQAGVVEIQEISQDSNVHVKTICADVFMDLQFFGNTLSQAIDLLQKLIDVAVVLGVRDIVIPCVDRSSLRDNPKQTAQFVEILKPFCQQASNQDIRLNFETDLGPKEFAVLLEQLGRENAWVNYDIGNSASLGFCPNEEFSAYGDRISNVHIKDRIFNGGSVVLGSGDADFQSVIAQLKSIDFTGPLIFQAARAADFTEDLSGINRQIEWFKQQWG